MTIGILRIEGGLLTMPTKSTCALLVILALSPSLVGAAAPDESPPRAESKAAAPKRAPLQDNSQQPSKDVVSNAAPSSVAPFQQQTPPVVVAPSEGKGEPEEIRPQPRRFEPVEPAKTQTVAPKLTRADSLPIGLVPTGSQISVRGSLAFLVSQGSAKAAQNHKDATSKPTKPTADLASPGLRIIDIASSPPVQLSVVTAPKDATLFGVALDGADMVYGLNQANAARVVRLGIDGSYRWQRPLDAQLLAPPVVLPKEDAAGDIAVLAMGSGPARLMVLDGRDGHVRLTQGLACKNPYEARLYVLGASRSVLTWCRSGSDAFFRVHDENVDDAKLRTVPSEFMAPPELAFANMDGSTRPLLLGEVNGAASAFALACFMPSADEDGACGERLALVDAPPVAGDEFEFGLMFGLAPGALQLSKEGALRLWVEGQLPSDVSSIGKGVTTASLATSNGKDWSLIAARDGLLEIYRTNLQQPAFNRMPYRDVALTSVVPRQFSTPESASIEGEDVKRLLVEGRSEDSLRAGFEATTLPPATPSAEAGASLTRTLIKRGDSAASGSEGTVTPSHPIEHELVVHLADGGGYALEDGAILHIDDAGKAKALEGTPSDGATVLGFDAVGPTLAMATASQVTLCTLAYASKADCQSQLTVPGVTGPIALGVDGRDLWVAVEDGKVRRWSRANVTDPFVPSAWSDAAAQPVHLLRAFAGELVVARGANLEFRSLSDWDDVRTSPLRADAVERCRAGRTFALANGQLWVADGDTTFRLMADQPPMIRSIGCDASGALLGAFTRLEVSTQLGEFRVPAKPAFPWTQCAWVTGGLGLTFVALYFARRDKPPITQTGEDEFDQSLGVDTPKANIASASEPQRRLVEALRDFLDNEQTQPPLTVGIYGEWGSGKSSLMRMLSTQLQSTGRYVTVWFNAWRHNKEEHLGPALLQSIVTQFQKQASPWLRVRNVVSSLVSSRRTSAWMLGAVASGVAGIEVSATSGLNAVSGVAFLTTCVTLWKSVVVPFRKLFAIEPVEAMSKSFAQRAGFLQEFNDEFERVVGSLPKNNYLAIFVDDLDRCPPDRVTDVLESLNRLMDSQMCFVVLGMDPVAVRHCIEIRYEAASKLPMRPGEPSYGERFLEKLVGIAVHAPSVAPDERTSKQRGRKGNTLAAQSHRGWVARGMDWVVPRLTRNIDRVLLAIATVAVLIAGAYWKQSAPASFARALGKAVAILTPSEQVPAKSEQAASSSAASRRDTAATPTVSSATAETPPPPIPLEPVRTTSTSKGKEQLFALSRQLDAPTIPVAAPLEAEAPRVTARIWEEDAATQTQHRIVVWLMSALALALLGALLVAYVYERARQGRKPALNDSTTFSQELEASLQTVDHNPRRQVRHENIARLTYYMLKKSQAPKHQGWEKVFFEFLSAGLYRRNPAQPPAPEHQWVVPEIGRWLGRVEKTTEESSAASAAADRYAHQSVSGPPQPVSSEIAKANPRG